MADLTTEEKLASLIGARHANECWLEVFEKLLVKNDEVWGSTGASEDMKDFHKLNVATLSGMKEQAEKNIAGYQLGIDAIKAGKDPLADVEVDEDE